MQTNSVAASARQLIDPIEALATKGIEFDTVVNPRRPSKLDVSFQCRASLSLEANATQADLADGYAQILEGYASRLNLLASQIRSQFCVVTE